MFDRAASDSRHRAVGRLPARLTGDYIARYEAKPVPVDVTAETYSHLLDIVVDAEVSLTTPAMA